MSFKELLESDIKKAMKSQDKDRLKVLRSLKSKLMEKEISERKEGEAELTEEQSVGVLMKAAKQRKESIDQFMEGGRDDLADIEKAELEIIEQYLPKMMEEEEVRRIVKEKIHSVGASGMQDMGKVMGPLMGQLKGKADGSLVSEIVKEELGG
ncbi:MAG: GatB/YqeY domain-containing protein [Gracilimonas sp.]|nr:GatB/YqeY domain-containing protein [Gracilimonas sp.]